MDGWKPFSFADLIDVKHGFAFLGEYFRDEPPGDVLLTPGNFAIGGGFTDRKLKFYDGPVPDDFVLSPGELLVSMTDLSKAGDTLGYPAFVPDDDRRYLHNQRLGKVIVKNRAPISIGFTHWIMRTSGYRDEILASCTGSTVKHTSPSRILAFKFMLPPVAEQQAIVSILGALDNKIELNRRMNETLETMARSIFKDWFVDFGPTRAKMKSRASYLSSDIWSLFSDRVDVEGKPEGWNKPPLITVCELKRGYDLPSQSRKSGPIPIISSSGPTGWHSEAMVTGPGIVTGRYGTIGQVFTCRADFWPLNTTLYVRDFKRNPYWFVYHTLLGLDFTKYSDKAAVPGVNRNALHLEQVTISPPELLQRFDEIVTPLMSRVEANTDQVETLASLRDLLLPKLMSGELRVKDAEKAVEKAV